MKVSVSLITYNHAPFIRQAIESVLMQETDFDFELLIGEDDSRDGTREIVREYVAKYPDRIRVFFHDRKDVLFIDGQPTGRRNFLHNLTRARGEYIALLEGDDFWTSPHKLQNQVEFLEQHSECSACFHPVRVIFENKEEDVLSMRRVAKDFYTLADILAAGFVIPTCSYFFRNRLPAEFPDWFFSLPMGDLPLHILVAQQGLLGYLNDQMGVYRVHSGGVASGGTSELLWPPEQRRRRAAMLLKYYEIIDRVLDLKYHPVIRGKLSMLNYDLVWTYQQQGNLSMMRHHLRVAARATLANPQTPWRFIVKAYIVAYGLYFDAVYQACRRIGSRSKS